MKVAALCLVFVGLASGTMFIRGKPPGWEDIAADTSKSPMGAKWMGSEGVICYSGDADVVGKVACGGGSATVSEVSDADSSLEFGMVLKCTGSETNLGKCEYAEQGGPNTCKGSFLAVKCAKKRDMGEFWGVM